VAKFASVCNSVKVKFVILPKTSSVFVGSLLGGAQAILERIALRVRYATYTAATSRVTGPAIAFVNKEMIAARVGTAAQQLQFIGVDAARFALDLDRGHLIAKLFGGRGIQANLVPLFKRVNQIEMRAIERDVAKLVASHGKAVEYTVEAIYGAHPSIPEFIQIVAKVDGKIRIDALIKNVP